MKIRRAEHALNRNCPVSDAYMLGSSGHPTPAALVQTIFCVGSLDVAGVLPMHAILEVDDKARVLAVFPSDEFIHPPAGQYPRRRPAYSWARLMSPANRMGP